MKQLLSILMLLPFAYPAFGQKPKVKADTFSFKQRNYYSEIILRNDSTYYSFEIGCSATNLNMGFWIRSKDTLLLSACPNPKVSITTDTLINEKSSDSLITFLVQDCFGNPISLYSIDFYTKDINGHISRSTSDMTNKKGTLRLRRDQYWLFTTQTDDDKRKINNCNYDRIHYRPILQNAKKITITITFPKEITQVNSEKIAYRYKLRKILSRGTYLLDSHTGHKYVRK